MTNGIRPARRESLHPSRILVLAALCVIPAAAQPAEKSPAPAASLTVSHQARSLQPGEVVLLTLHAPQPLRSAEAEAFGKTFPFFQEGDATVWAGLLGIDLEVAAGRREVRIRAVQEDGKTLATRYDLAVKSKQFPTRRIQVKQEYVTPPAEQLERIRMEAERVRAIFAAVTPQRFWSGVFLRPVPGAATSSFGSRSIVNGQPRSPHTGADFHAAEGTPVKAPNAGKVVLVSDLYFSGNTVILDHGQGLYSYFAHLSRFTVSEGEAISTGDLVGYAGATGRVTGPHLHWTLRLAEARVNPLSLLELFFELE